MLATTHFFLFFFFQTDCQTELPEVFIRCILCKSVTSLRMISQLNITFDKCRGGRQHIASEKDLHKLMISFHFTLFLQMLGEQFMPRHTSRREWCNCSGVKVSLPSWPPSSRSPPRQESSSPSTNQNTGKPSVILFILACSSSFFRALVLN